MTTHWPVTQAQADQYFKEALGALAWWACQPTITTTTASLNTDNHYRTVVTADEAKKLVKSLTPALVNAIGVFLYVYPYERYKKECAIQIQAHLPKDGRLDPRKLNEAAQTAASQAFFADTWATRATFEARFPRSTVDVWNPPANAFPSWAADCVRNTFAHAQTTFVQVGPDMKLQLWNSVDGNFDNANFRVKMDLRDFLKMTKDCTDAFILSCVPNKRYEPLQKLIKDFV